jgi:hypothetical protein
VLLSTSATKMWFESPVIAVTDGLLVSPVDVLILNSDQQLTAFALFLDRVVAPVVKLVETVSAVPLPLASLPSAEKYRRERLAKLLKAVEPKPAFAAMLLN